MCPVGIPVPGASHEHLPIVQNQGFDQWEHPAMEDMGVNYVYSFVFKVSASYLNG